MKRSRLAALASAAAAAVLCSAAPAEATFPGEVNGRIAWAGIHDGKRGIFTSQPDGSDTQQLLAGGVGQPAWAPHGEQVAFTTFGQIGVVGADGSGWTMLTDRSEIDIASEPAWSPDGTKIVFVGYSSQSPYGGSYYGGSHDLYSVDVDGTHITRITDTPYEYESSPEWSPDGTRIAFARSTQTGPPYWHYSHDIYTVRPDGGDLANLTNGGYNNWPSWSPDSSKIVFTRSAWGGEGVISTIGADGTGYKDLVVTGMAPIFSPDGKQIAYTRHVPYPAQTSAIALMPADGGALTMITSLDDVAFEADWQALQAWPDYSSPPKVETPAVEVPVPAGEKPAAPPAPPTDFSALMRAYLSGIVGQASTKLGSLGVAGVGKGFSFRQVVPAAGELQVDVLTASTTARAAAAKRRLLATGRATATAPGKVKVKVKPTKAGRKAAKKAKKMRVIVRVTYSPVGAPKSTSQSRVTIKRRKR